MAIFEKRKHAQTLEFSQVLDQSYDAPRDEPTPVDDDYMGFSSQFRELGEQNLSLPRIQDTLTGALGWVYFGHNNDFPQIVNQAYYTSPINGAIIDFKTNATIGGGFSLTPNDESYDAKAKTFIFERRHNIKKLLAPLTRDMIMHACCYVILKFSDAGKLLSFKRVPREHVRTSKDKKLYYICSDWSTQIDVRPIRKFNGVGRDREMLLCFEEDCVGQDTYSIATYTSCLNWCELDGKMSLLHKNNILNAIFASVAFLFPKKPSGEKEKQLIQKTISGAKGASNAGRVIALFANKKEQMPEIQAIPTNQNDKLFEQTDGRIDAQVCKAHCIDPLLLGIRVSGSLGQGNELKQSYVIFEKNTVFPIRRWIEQIMTELLAIAGVPAKFEVNNYQIINETIVEIEENDNLRKLVGMPDKIQDKFLEGVTSEQLAEMIGIKLNNKP